MKATQLQLTEEPQAPEPSPARESASPAVTVDVSASEPVIDMTESRADASRVELRGGVVDVTDHGADFLSARDRRILAMERQWFSNAGSKEAAITRRFGMTPTRYFQVLNGLLDDPRAMREYPQVIARLRRLRTARQRSRRRYRRVLRHRG